jgi:hypothetical protein
MSPPLRLKRLLAVRRVRLQAAARRLGDAAKTLALLQQTHLRIDRLRDELGQPVQMVAAYGAKATAAAREMLGTANLRQTQRIVSADRVHQTEAATVAADRAASDVVAQAVERQALLPIDHRINLPPKPRRTR